MFWILLCENKIKCYIFHKNLLNEYIEKLHHINRSRLRSSGMPNIVGCLSTPERHLSSKFYGSFWIRYTEKLRNET